ncbi:MAG: NUDIX domain-containing protein [Alphaproteobacteria bacterium]|nr:NUDIX domain-containing protein [Alphaproteobacteria bacterium]
MKEAGPRIKKIPAGDTHERLVCPECDYIAYDNPKIVNIVIAVYKDKKTGEEEFLFCKRAISPVGKWTLPGGYMENGETLRKGALREAFEEATAKPKVGALVAIYQPPSKHEVIMIFRGDMRSRKSAPGIESLETKFFKWKDIPWNELAFPFIADALKAYKKTKDNQNFAPIFLKPRPRLWPRGAVNGNMPPHQPPKT